MICTSDRLYKNENRYYEHEKQTGYNKLLGYDRRQELRSKRAGTRGSHIRFISLNASSVKSNFASK
jgi:hypothetical protein